MKTAKRCIAAFVLALFLINSIHADLAFSQEAHVDNLSPASKFSEITDAVGRDVSRIQLAVSQILSESLKSGDTPKQTAKSPDDIHVFFGEQRPTFDNKYCVMCRIDDGTPRTYYAIYSLNKDQDGGFPIQVMTEAEFRDQPQALSAFNPAKPEISPGLISIDALTEKQLSETSDRAITITGQVFTSEIDVSHAKGLTSDQIEFLKSRQKNKDPKAVWQKVRDSKGGIKGFARCRGTDFLGGSSYDLRSFQAIFGIQFPTMTIPLAAAMALPLKIEAITNPDDPDNPPDVIEYVNPSVFQGTHINKGEVQFTSNGRFVNGMKDFPAYILRNILGLKGFRITCDPAESKGMAPIFFNLGGLESSDAFTVLAASLAFSIGDVDVTEGELFNVAIGVENAHAGAFAGGQGFGPAMRGSGIMQFLSGLRDPKTGERLHPYSFVFEPLDVKTVNGITEKMAMVEFGRPAKGSQGMLPRDSDLINTVWCDGLHHGDPVVLENDEEMYRITKDNVDAVKRADLVRLAENNRRFVQCRLDNEKHWFQLMAKAKENIDGRTDPAQKTVYKTLPGDKYQDLPDHAYIYYRKVFDPAFVAEPIDLNKSALVDYLVKKFPEDVRSVARERIIANLAPLIADNTNYNSYKLVRMLIDAHGIDALTSGRVNLYNYGEIESAMRLADEYNRKNGTHIVIFPGGAGGPYSVCVAFCPEGMEHVKSFLKSLGIPEANKENMAEAQEMLEGKKTGSFKLWAPMVTGDETPGIQWEGLMEAGFKPVRPAQVSSISIANTEAAGEMTSAQPRNPDGTFGFRPGKSPMDAFTVLSLSRQLKSKLSTGFTLNDYLAAYDEVREANPDLGFEKLAKNPETTARRDLDALVKAKRLSVSKNSDGAARYSVQESPVDPNKTQKIRELLNKLRDPEIHRENLGGVSRGYDTNAGSYGTWCNKLIDMAKGDRYSSEVVYSGFEDIVRNGIPWSLTREWAWNSIIMMAKMNNDYAERALNLLPEVLVDRNVVGAKLDNLLGVDARMRTGGLVDLAKISPRLRDATLTALRQVVANETDEPNAFALERIRTISAFPGADADGQGVVGEASNSQAMDAFAVIALSPSLANDKSFSIKQYIDAHKVIREDHPALYIEALPDKQPENIARMQLHSLELNGKIEILRSGENGADTYRFLDKASLEFIKAYAEPFLYNDINVDRRNKIDTLYSYANTLLEKVREDNTVAKIIINELNDQFVEYDESRLYRIYPVWDMMIELVKIDNDLADGALNLMVKMMKWYPGIYHAHSKRIKNVIVDIEKIAETSLPLKEKVLAALNEVLNYKTSEGTADWLIRDIKNLIAKISAMQTRNADGTYARKLGKSPEDAWKVIVSTPSLQAGKFSLKDYLTAYEAYRMAHPEAGFDPLAANPAATASADLAVLVERKYLVTEKVDGRRSYELSPAERGVIEKRKETFNLATAAGIAIPTHPASRYTLYLPNDFFAQGELEAERSKYSERFNIETASGQTTEQVIRNVLGKAKGKERQAVVLVSDQAQASELADLATAGIRFVRVDLGKLREAREKDAEEWRKTSQQDTYAIMLLVRALDPNMPEDSPVKKMLKFYLKTHFELTDAVTIDGYINALAKDDITRLIKGMLMYRPAEQYRVPEYNNVAATLISA